MKKSPFILLLLLLCIVLASALIHQDDLRPPVDSRNDPHYLMSSPKGNPGYSGRLFIPFMHYQDTSADGTDFLEDNIMKAETISPKLMLLTSFLKEEGNDIQKLENLVNEYDLLVKDARINFDLAAGSDSHAVENGNISPEMTEEEYLDISRKSIMQSNKLLRDIFHEIKPYVSGNDFKLWNASFAAEGSGMVMLSGDFDADISLINGRISYMDGRNNMKIEFETGNISAEVLTSSRNNMVFYDNVNGNVTVSGSGYTLAIFGENISMSSKGTGDVKLFGKGYYQVTDPNGVQKKKLWVPNLFEDN